MCLGIIRMQCVSWIIPLPIVYAIGNCADEHNCIKRFYIRILIIHNASLNGKSKNDCRSQPAIVRDFYFIPYILGKMSEKHLPRPCIILIYTNHLVPSHTYIIVIIIIRSRYSLNGMRAHTTVSQFI